MNESITVLIPAYNEEKLIQNTALELKKYLDSLISRKIISSYEIIICINGSTDRTEAISRELSKRYAEIKYFSIREKGMGIALTEGTKRATNDIVTFIAADGEVLNEFIEPAIILLKNYDLVSGSRYLVKSQIRGSNLTRMLLSICFAYFIRIFFSSKLTEVGTIKAFRRAPVQKFVNQLKRSDPSWQVEILYHALSNKLKIKELPVYIQIKRLSSESKVRILREIYSFFKTTLKFSLALRWNQIKEILCIKY